MRLLFFVLVALFAIVLPSGGEVQPIMVGNGVAGQFCDVPEKRLYERDGAFFCAPYGWLWHGDTRYVVLGDTGPFRTDIADAVALAARLSGSWMIEGGTPEMTLVLATQPLNAAEIRRRAAAAGATLAEEDARWVEKLAEKNSQRGGGGSGSMVYPIEGERHSVSVLNARPHSKAAEGDTGLKDDIRDDVLAHFSISLPQNSPDENECDMEFKRLGSIALAVLTEGAEGHWCGAKALYSGEAGFFCAPYPKEWPRQPTYSLIGPDAKAFATDIATSVDHIRRLTGLRMTESAPPDMLVLLTENASSEADLKTAMAQAGTKPRHEKAGIDSDAISRLLAMRLKIAKAEDPGLVERANAFPMRTATCADVRLNDVIKTKGRSHGDIAKDIDDAFLQFFDVSPPKDRSDGVLREPVAGAGRPTP